MYSEKGSPSGIPRNYWQDIKALVKEFCRESSIHGFKYFVGTNRALIERTWWIVVACLSVYGCGDLMINVYQKWLQAPVIVSFDTKSTPVFRVPFPSVTICPEIKAKVSFINFTASYYEAIAGTLTEESDAERIGKLLAMMQVCNIPLYEVFNDQDFDDDCVEMLELMEIPHREIFLSCMWRDNPVDCDEKFKRTLTDRGLCYTFNSLSAKDLLRTEELNTDYEYIQETRPIVNWTLDDGYSKDATRGVYPQRILGAGTSAGLQIALKANVSDLDYLCSTTFQGFEVLLHMPNDYPQMSQGFIRAPLNQQLLISVTPDVIMTSEDVKGYQPHRRQCYFDKERYLRFFRIYSQKNCQLECLTNYTLKRCGCVRFSMPRPPNTNICGLNKIECYKMAVVEILMSRAKMVKIEDRSFKDCDCLPSCSKIRYHSELSQSNFEWRKLLPFAASYRNSTNGTELTSLVVLFRDDAFIPVIRRELYGTTDLLANCGGLLGLFMGISLLSLVEILYYCTIKPVVMWWKGANQVVVKQVTPIAAYKSPFVFESKSEYYKTTEVGKFYLK